MSANIDVSALPTVLSGLGLTLDTWTPEELRDIAARCRHRAARLRREPPPPEITGEDREQELRRAEEYAAAAVLCEHAASRMSSAA
ncbi:MAG: hypothetical protein QM820_46500 [Minicystis sp.]